MIEDKINISSKITLTKELLKKYKVKEITSKLN